MDNSIKTIICTCGRTFTRPASYEQLAQNTDSGGPFYAQQLAYCDTCLNPPVSIFAWLRRWF